MGEWSYSSAILDLGTRWRRVVGFKPPSLYPQGKCPQYQLNRRLGGAQSRSGRYEEEKCFASAGSRTPAVQLIACCID
jgi:hypothetical protein